MVRPLELLKRRVAELDADSEYVAMPEGQDSASPNVCRRLIHFVNVIGSYTDTFMQYEIGNDAVIDPDVADAATMESALLGYLRFDEPTIVGGPIALDRQYWVRTDTASDATRLHPIAPTNSQFVTPTEGVFYNIKPAGIGLYTSSGLHTGQGQSMWRIFLACNGPGTLLYQLPWVSWALGVHKDVKVAEIDSARSWLEFVCAHPYICGGHVVVDWSKVAQKFDGVHVTLAAIVAAQGFSFMTDFGVVLPAFWDVESTLWLKWAFSNWRQIELIQRD